MTSDLLAFWRQVAANPADAAPRLVFCDWLEEQAGAVPAARALDVIRRGQLWQVANHKWPRWEPDATGDWFLWYAEWRFTIRRGGRPGTPRILPRDLFDHIRRAFRRDGMALEVHAEWLTYRTICEAEWALAVALDRQAWQAKREEVWAILGKASATAALDAMRFGRVAVPTPDVPPELLPGLLDYESPEAPFAQGDTLPLASRASG